MCVAVISTGGFRAVGRTQGSLWRPRGNLGRRVDDASPGRYIVTVARRQATGSAAAASLAKTASARLPSELGKPPVKSLGRQPGQPAPMRPASVPASQSYTRTRDSSRSRSYRGGLEYMTSSISPVSGFFFSWKQGDLLLYLNQAAVLVFPQSPIPPRTAAWLSPVIPEPFVRLSPGAWWCIPHLNARTREVRPSSLGKATVDACWTLDFSVFL